MIVIAAMIVGALTSASWVAPKPWCYIFSLAAWSLFIWIRSVN
jgi:hypothetical protein